jgi:hypothetical protein
MRSFLVAALIGLAAALTAPVGANAASCWQRVLEDWRDGRLDHAYPVHCYRDALRNMPEDLRVYGTAESDIQNALARALAHSAVDKQPAARVPAARTTTTHVTTTPRASAPAPDRARTLAGRSAAQPKLRFAAAAEQDVRGSGFPLTKVIAGALALGATLVVLASLYRYVPRRVRR